MKDGYGLRKEAWDLKLPNEGIGFATYEGWDG